MPVSAAQFQRCLDSQELPAVVLIASNEPLLRLEAADAFRAAARKQGFAEREVFDVDGASFDWSRVSQSAHAMSLFASRRIIELRLPSGRPSKDGEAFIQSFCAQPTPDVLLLIVADEWSKKHEKPWSTAVDQQGMFLLLWPLKAQEMAGWLGRRLRAHGLHATDEAIAQLVERVEGNLLAAAQEIDKLVLLQPGGMMDETQMASLVADSARFDVFSMTEAAIQSDPARALRILASLRAEGQLVPALLSWPTLQIQALLSIAEADERGGNVAQAMTNERIWDSKVEEFKRALRRGDRAHYQALLVQCAHIERIGKGREAGDPWQEMERLLVALAQGRNARRLLRSA